MSALTIAVPATAQESFPSKPVRLVVPFAAAGPLDVIARVMAQKLNGQWGRPGCAPWV